MNKEFLLKAKKGDEEAQLQLINKYKPLVNKYSTRYNLKGFERNDLVQEGNMSILKAISKFDMDRDPKLFDSYAINSIRNNYNSLVRSKINTNYESSLNITTEEGYEIIDLIVDAINIEDSLITKTNHSALKKALRKLTSKELELLHLVFFKEGGNLNQYCKDKSISFYQGKKLLNKIMDKLKYEVY